MTKNKGKIFLVGSIPLNSVEEVFHLCGTLLADHLLSIPDGEVGDRTFWILYLAYRTYHGHPDIETIQRPEPPEWKPTSMDNCWAFKLKPGVEKLRLESLGYADEAIKSYIAFRDAREKGDIPPGVRFQIAFPFPQDATYFFFRDPTEHKAVMAAYEEALRSEIETILNHIPANELCIQWDVCTDLLEMTGRYYSWSRPETAWDRYISPLRRLPREVPRDVMMGFHFCYGTFPQKPAIMPEDLTLSVKFANAAVAESGRRVDFVHLTVPRIRTDDVYFRPLEDLDIGDTRAYLGVINTDGVEATKERIAVARKFLPDFGLAAECGFGRERPEDIPGIIDLHKQVADDIF
ncbi:MAG: hypothetical protein OXE42_18445 [Gammaproteobacteria bacterium]|nr:hypothetical protein [Gammaproteobacteria bacterium]